MNSPDFDPTRLVGMDPDQAVLVAKAEGIARVRVLQVVGNRTKTVQTMDYDPARLNVYVEDGKVIGGTFS